MNINNNYKFHLLFNRYIILELRQKNIYSSINEKNPKEEINSVKKTIETLFWIFAIFFFFFVIPVVPLISIFIYSKLVSKNVKESVTKFGNVVNENKFFCSFIALLSLFLLILFWVSKDIVNDNNIEDENKCDKISNNGIVLLSLGLVIITITSPKLYKLYQEYKEEKKEKEKASLQKKNKNR